MKRNIKPCLEEHFPGKAKPGTAISDETWFGAAATHLQSARTILDLDPAAAFLLGWESMHKTAKGIAAVAGCRLEGKLTARSSTSCVVCSSTCRNLRKGSSVAHRPDETP